MMIGPSRWLMLLVVLGLVALAACERRPQGATDSRAKLLRARADLRTRLVTGDEDNDPAPNPPTGEISLVRYDSPAGKLVAYLTAAPRDGKRHPAIIWITGGDCNTIGDVWSRGPRENDQTARAFRELGVVTMYPALRGGNGGPGRREGWLGEVDDVVAAGEFLARQEGVDAQRIYLGGHSTGGTLVLMVAECNDRFRAVFSFGAAGDVSGYGKDMLPFDASKRDEVRVRSPIHWLEAVRTPTFVIEGTSPPTSNIASLRAMERAPHDPSVRFVAVGGVDHFGVLDPLTRLIASKIVQDTGPTCAIVLTDEEAQGAVRR
jgi:dipeptidyl aminopeptidase/acylaminoacyl peptidase